MAEPIISKDDALKGGSKTSAPTITPGEYASPSKNIGKGEPRVRVKNNKASPIGVPAPPPKNSRGVNVGLLFVLPPGFSEVRKVDWETALKHDMVNLLVKKKVLVVSSATPPNRLELDEAVELIAATFDADVLRSWRKIDRREEVLEAIDSQLEVLTAKPDKDEDLDE